MGRPYRVALGGYVYHVLNRANGRLPIFQKDGDYAAFERILDQALEHVAGMRLLAYCLLPNHWHLVLWPRRDGALSDFGHWLTLTHTQRWHAHHHNVGTGHSYRVVSSHSRSRERKDRHVGIRRTDDRPASAALLPLPGWPPFRPT